MSDIIYLEPDEEITKLIDRLRESRSDSITFVFPRGSTLAQSIINLKILKRSAEELGKIISIVTADGIARNVAAQLNLTVYSKVTEAENAGPIKAEMHRREIGSSKTNGSQESSATNKQDGPFRVNTYSRYMGDESENDENAEITPREPIDLADAENDIPPEKEVKEESWAADIRPAPPKLIEEEVKTTKAKEGSQTEDREMVPISRGRIKSHRSASSSSKSFFVFTAIVILVIFSAAYIFLPTGSVALQLKTDDYKSDFEVSVDKNIEKTEESSTVTIPGKTIEVEKELSKEFNSTGKKDVGEKAHGTITVKNNYDTNPHKYPKGSRFSSNGKTYLSDDLFTVKAATIGLVGGNAVVTPGEVDITVTAESSGDSYNASGGTYVLEGAPAKIYGSGGEMTGGVTREVGVVLDKDLDGAETSIKKDALEEAKKELSDSAAKNNIKLADASISSEMISASSSKNANDEADKFTYTAKIKVYGLGFNEEKLRQAVIAMANAKIGNGQMVVGGERSTMNYEVSDHNSNFGKMNLKVSFSGKVGQQFSDSDIKALVKGKSVSRATLLLKAKSGVESTEVSVSPSLVKQLPFITKRINVKFDYSEN